MKKATIAMILVLAASLVMFGCIGLSEHSGSQSRSIDVRYPITATIEIEGVTVGFTLNSDKTVRTSTDVLDKGRDCLTWIDCDVQGSCVVYHLVVDGAFEFMNLIIYDDGKATLSGDYPDGNFRIFGGTWQYGK